MSNAAEIKERLDKYIELKGFTYPSLESMANLTNGYLRNNSGGFSAPKLSEIAAVCPDLNLNWLLTGIEPMLLPVAGGSVTKDGDIVSGDKVVVKKNKGGRNIGKVDTYLEKGGEVGFFDTYVSLAMIESVKIEDVPKKHVSLVTEIQQRKTDLDNLKAELQATKAQLREAQEDAKKSKDELLDFYRKQLSKEV